jgi:Flp pilus assembly protein TadD
MRAAVLFLLAGLLSAQAPDPAYEPLTQAYAALRAKDYSGAIAGFKQAAEVAPKRASIRKDLGYAYLKAGESELAREEFRAAMALEPDDAQVAMEYAFLCYETKERREARRVFDRVRKTGNATAEQAFRNIDEPLAAGIERWKQALAAGGGNFAAHFELARLAEERDELALAAENYEKAWRFRPDRRYVLVDLGRTLKEAGREADANAALLAASRGGEPRAAEMARELLPGRYPYVSEFVQALQLDPGNAELRRELGFLLLKMEREPDAEPFFKAQTEMFPEDWLAATQLGFLLNARGEREAAKPLFDRVLASPDEEMANRVRAVLRLPQVPRETRPAVVSAKEMADRSFKAGFMADALKYLQMAHEADPGDFAVTLRLGWTHNIMGQDKQALEWFNLARKSPEAAIAQEAGGAYRNLKDRFRRFRTTVWMFPAFSSRWHDVFAYGQAKTELRHASGFVRPYVSVRFIGDSRGEIGAVSPVSLSERSVIFAAGVRSMPRKGVTLWAEAGTSLSYANGHATPDYRGGVALARGIGRLSGHGASGWFADTTVDGVFISRFNKDFLVYQQGRVGRTFGGEKGWAQAYWNGNITADSRREDWANFVETGPGARIAAPFFPAGMYFTANAVRGAYLTGNRPAFNDIRAGFWYAFSY